MRYIVSDIHGCYNQYQMLLENYDSHLTSEILLDYNLWLQDGGQVTAEKFRELSYSEKMDVLDYIEGASLYEVIESDSKEYRLDILEYI